MPYKGPESTNQKSRKFGVFDWKLVERHSVRDFWLITGSGWAATKWEGGQVKFYPYEKGGGPKKF